MSNIIGNHINLNQSYCGRSDSQEDIRVAGIAQKEKKDDEEGETTTLEEVMK